MINKSAISIAHSRLCPRLLEVVARVRYRDLKPSHALLAVANVLYASKTAFQATITWLRNGPYHLRPLQTAYCGC